jgi:hypothetical protein
MKRDEQCQANTEDNQRHEEVTVGENGFGVWGNLHGGKPASVWGLQQAKTIIG